MPFLQCTDTILSAAGTNDETLKPVSFAGIAWFDASDARNVLLVAARATGTTEPGVYPCFKGTFDAAVVK